MKRKLLSIVSLVLVLVTVLSIPALAATSSLPSLSSSKYIKTYTLKSSGKVYGYKESSLKNQSGWIDCSTDECYIIRISGNAVQVSFPISGGRTTRWFKRSDFTSTDISKSQTVKVTTAQITTYRRNDGKNTYGYTGNGDTIYVLGSSNGYTQIIYELTGGNWKMGWIKNADANSKLKNPTNNNNSTNNGNKKSSSGSFDPIWPVAGNSGFYVTTMNWYYAYDYVWKNGKKLYYPTPHAVGGYVNYDCTYALDISGSGNIVAIEDGKVIESKDRGSGFGNVIAIQHSNGEISFYAHLKSRNVFVNNTVKKGDVIGVMGKTGGNYGVHLHFEYTGCQPWYMYRDKYKTQIKYGTNVYSANKWARDNAAQYVENGKKQGASYYKRYTYVKNPKDPIYRDICTWIENSNYKVENGWNVWRGK